MKRLFLIFVFFCCFSARNTVYAAADFDADYTVEYAVSPQGVAIVTQKVTLTNRQTNLYPKEYAITIDTDHIKNVIARDKIGIITPKINQAKGTTEIILPFNEQVVGLGKTLTFTLRYENLDVAIKNGSIWEINIPGVVDEPNLNSYDVTLQVPPTFGPNAYMSPLPQNGKWSKEQMIHGGISAAYGQTQNVTATIGYFLQNDRLSPGQSEIAIPPDTAFQTVSIESISPQPSAIRRDSDGNWLAVYDLAPLEKKRVETKLAIQIHLNPDNQFQQPIDIPSYTKSLPYWESTDETIAKIAKTLTTPRAIYDYVVQHLTYDYTRVGLNPERFGARKALEEPTKAICMEFTDLFIALARASGIPAREAVGYAFTSNSKLRPLSLVADVLHAWPEYYDTDKKIWIPVDPTWGNTTGGVNYFDKLDFNHVVFALHGLSSVSPFPAGSYKDASDEGKDITIVFSDIAQPQSHASLKASIQFPDRVPAGKPVKGLVTIANESGTSISEADITIDILPYAIHLSKSERFVPPFSRFQYPIAINSANFIERNTGQIRVVVNGTEITKNFNVEPMYWLLLPAAGVIVSIIFLVWFMLMHLSLWKQRRKS